MFEDACEIAIDELLSSVCAEVVTDPTAHTNIVKRKIKLFLIGFQLSFIVFQDCRENCGASEL